MVEGFGMNRNGIMRKLGDCPNGLNMDSENASNRILRGANDYPN